MCYKVKYVKYVLPFQEKCVCCFQEKCVLPFEEKCVLPFQEKYVLPFEEKCVLPFLENELHVSWLWPPFTCDIHTLLYCILSFTFQPNFYIGLAEDQNIGEKATATSLHWEEDPSQGQAYLILVAETTPASV